MGIQRMKEYFVSLGMPSSLTEVGIASEDIPALVALAMGNGTRVVGRFPQTTCQAGYRGHLLEFAAEGGIMKRNDFAVFMAYVCMFAVALLVGLLVIRPIMSDYGASFPINFVVLVVLSLIVGIVLNGLLLEGGHLLGAKIGGYEVLSCVVFMIGVKKKDGKFAFGLHSYDGLTGETKVAPKDVEKSSLGAYAFLPIFLYIVEAVVLMVVNAVTGSQLKETPSLAWLQVFSITILSVGGMIFLYDIFPFRMDSNNDGYLFTILSHNENRVAYNYYLLKEKSKFLGVAMPPIRTFDQITEFTAYLNYFAIYDHVSKGEFDQAVALLDKIIQVERGIGHAAKYDAACFKLTLLLASSKTSIGVSYYNEFTDEQKKYIANLPTMPALRSYLLISSCVEDSEAEANFALDKVEKVLSTLGKEEPLFLDSEKALVQYDKQFVAKMHPAWDLFPLPWEEPQREEGESNE